MKINSNLLLFLENHLSRCPFSPISSFGLHLLVPLGVLDLFFRVVETNMARERGVFG